VLGEFAGAAVPCVRGRAGEGARPEGVGDAGGLFVAGDSSACGCVAFDQGSQFVAARFEARSLGEGGGGVGVASLEVVEALGCSREGVLGPAAEIGDAVEGSVLGGRVGCCGRLGRRSGDLGFGHG